MGRKQGRALLLYLTDRKVVLLHVLFPLCAVVLLASYASEVSLIEESKAIKKGHPVGLWEAGRSY